MDREQMYTELAFMGKRAAPALAGSAGSAGLAVSPDNITVLGMTTSHWAIAVSIVTLCYVACQAFFLFRDKWWRDPERKKRRRKIK